MIKKGRFKYIHYVGYEPELFDLANDPEEFTNLAGEPRFREVVATYQGILHSICDPLQQNRRAMADQKKMIEAHGGYEAVAAQGYMQGSPPPGYEPELLM